MKVVQILFIILFSGIIYWIASSTHILELSKEGFESSKSEPIIPKGVSPTSVNMQAMPNPMSIGNLPYGEYGQMASTGSFQFKDPSSLPAELTQMRKIATDVNSFLALEAVNIENTSDPTIQLPLTQLRADNEKIKAEMAVLGKNPGVPSQLTQQDLADIEGSLTFLQKKVRLLQTSDVIPGGEEGFKDGGSTSEKTRATKDDLLNLQKRIYAANLVLASSGTSDPVVQARIKRLETMYSAITDLITKLNNGDIRNTDIPIYKEDITEILPKLADTSYKIKNVFEQSSGKKLNAIEKELSQLVGEDHAQSVFKNLKDTGVFRVNFELGYNGSKNSASDMKFKKDLRLNDNEMHALNSDIDSVKPMNTEMPFDSLTPGMDDNAMRRMGQMGQMGQVNPSSISRFDWKKRATSICEQVRLRGLDPEDFGCLAKGTIMSPAYSWRGHTKMICGRLAATSDPDLPVTCGCPPSNWKGWTLSIS